MAVKSIFENYADNLQVVIDSAQDRFAPLWYPKYFTFDPKQTSLKFDEAIGRSRIEAMASVVDRDSETPLRSRGKAEVYTGTIPAIKQMFPMSETDYREWENMQNSRVSDKVKLNQMLSLLFNDVKKCGDAVHKRLDYMALQAISTGEIDLTVANNPDGVILDAPLDLLMKAENKKQGAVSWATTATATPLKDIQDIVTFGVEKGISFAKILMSRTLWYKFIATDEVKNNMLTYFFGPKAANSGAQAVTTLGKINEYLDAMQYPIIEIVDEVMGIEKDGKIETVRPFNQNNASFIPAGRLGTIKNAVALEELRPVPHVSYSEFNGALISKWSQNEPFREWTKGEFNAFPAFSAIDSTVILTAVF